MNDRIKELAKQAGMEDFPIYGVNTLYGEDSIRKFAELIVQECVNETFDSKRGIGAYRWKDDVLLELREHFGVE